MEGRCGWAGGEPGAQRQRSAGPALGRSYEATEAVPDFEMGDRAPLRAR